MTIEQANRVFAASREIRVFEEGIKLIVDDIEDLVSQGRSRHLFLVTGSPGSGVTFLLDNILPLTSIKMRPDFYSFQPTYAERLADALGMLQSGETLRQVPRYLFEALRSTGRKNIIMDDVDCFCCGQNVNKKLQNFIHELLHGPIEVNLIVSTKQKALLAGVNFCAQSTHLLNLSEHPEEASGHQYAKEYCSALSKQLGVYLELNEKELTSTPIGDIVHRIQTASIAALVRGESVLDLTLISRKDDADELARYLGCATP